MVDAVLVFPPAYYPWFVAPGLSYLASYLRGRGFSVAQRDANVPAIEYLLSCRNLARLGAPASLIDRVDTAFETMRSEAAHHALWPYLDAKTAVEQASEFVDGHLADTFRIFRNTFQYISAHDARRRAGVVAAVEDRKNHAFHDYFVEKEIPAIAGLEPRLLGLSVNDHHQLIPAFVLASLVKDRLPDTHVCIGGNLIARLKATLESPDPETRQLFDYVDSFIHHEGEQPLAELLAGLKEGDSRRTSSRQPASGWPVAQQIGTIGDGIVSGPPSVPIDLRELPVPEADAYRPWTPVPVAALNVYRGCYYSGICSFCDINEGYDSVRHERDAQGKEKIRFGKRLRPMRMVAQDMIELERRHGGRVFSFTDEWFRVQEMLELGRHLEDAGKRYHWEAYARFERAYLDPETCLSLRRAGARFLQFGLESIAPATLKQMHKGNTPDEYARILANTTAAGIWNHVFFIVGYPGEPIHHVLPLFLFLSRNQRDVLTIKPTRFQLARRAPLIHDVPDLIEPVPEGEWDFFINIPFRYRQFWWCRRCRSKVEEGEVRHKAGRGKCPACASWLERWAPQSRKGVDAIYVLSEVLCEHHWAHRVTSLYPYVSRLFLSTQEMERFASALPPRKVMADDVVADALVKIRGALQREAEMIEDIGRVYTSGGLSLPDAFTSFEQFMEFCAAWEAAAIRACS